MRLQLNINGQLRELDVDPKTPLVSALRESLNLTGTGFGCGSAMCGACVVHVDGEPMRSCALPVRAVRARNITTIEGLGDDHPVQRSWISEKVPRCGHCQSGQLMTAAALLNANPTPTDADIDRAMSANDCGCYADPRVRRAIKAAAAALQHHKSEGR